jgi:hypothetical protein
MDLQIPDRHKPFLSAFFGLSNGEVDSLFAALEKANPAIAAPVLAQRVTRDLKTPLPELTGILTALMSLILTRYEHKRTAAEVASDVVEEAAEEELIPKDDPAVQDALKQRLARFLSLERPLAVTSRASDVLIRHQNPFGSARVLSDVRYVFSMEDAPVPAGGLIVHNLELGTYTSDGNRVTHYFALDSLDVRALQKVLDRAVKKEDALRVAIEASGIPYISMEP